MGALTFQIGKAANSNIGANVSKVCWPNSNPAPNDKIIIFEKFCDNFILAFTGRFTTICNQGNVAIVNL